MKKKPVASSLYIRTSQAFRHVWSITLMIIFSISPQLIKKSGVVSPHRCISASTMIRLNSQCVRTEESQLSEGHQYNDVIMGAMASQITSLTIVYSTVCSGPDQRKHQRSAPLAFVRGIHRSPVTSPHTGLVTRKIFPFDDVIMAEKSESNSS